MKDKMYGFIYCTTNLINGKKYIGQHKYCGKIDKYYLGSGVALNGAIKKYGRENFKREIICECKTLEELNEKEVYYINLWDAVNSKNFYNLGLGGNGMHGNNWWHYATPEQIKHANDIRSMKMSGKNNPFYGKKHTQETKKLLSKLASQKIGSKNPFFGKHITPEHRKIMQEAQGDISGKNNPFYGKKHSLETRQKISELARQRTQDPNYVNPRSLCVVLEDLKTKQKIKFLDNKRCFTYLVDKKLNIGKHNNYFAYNTFRDYVGKKRIFNNMIAYYDK